MAVLMALATFSTNLPIHWLGSTLSFLSIAGVVTVWFELNSQIPKKTSLRLFLFRYVLLWGLTGLVIYWLLAYRAFWNAFLFVPFFIVILFAFFSTMKQFTDTPFISKYFGSGVQKKLWQKILIFFYKTFLFFGFSFCFIFALSLSPFLNQLLDFIKVHFN